MEAASFLLVISTPLNDQQKDIANSRTNAELEHKCSAPKQHIKCTNINKKLKTVKER